MSNRVHFLVVLAVFLIVGCSSDSSTSPSPTTTSTTPTSSGPSSASITVTIMDAAFVGTNQGNAVGFELRLQESAGLGANINYIRVDVYRATGQFEERQEIGSGEINRQTGSNRLNASTTRTIVPVITFNATIKTGRILRLTVGLTDDRGNDHTKVGDFVFQ
jgi:hypothetical protein